jgi:hypothetical protein
LAILLASRPNCVKLWKRFAPSADVVPPVMSKRLPSGVMRVPVPSAAGTMGSAASDVTLRRVKEG